MRFVRLIAIATALLVVVTASEAGAKRKKSSRRFKRTETYIVVKGDNLGTIAKKHGCTVDELKYNNRLRKDVIQIGQKLRIPKKRGRDEGKPTILIHEVLPGDTLGRIAKRYGRTIEDIKQRNKLRRNAIRAGQKLKVLALVPARQRRKFVYTIEPGDTLASIAGSFAMNWRQIKRLNPRVNPRRLQIGDTINVYKDGPETASSAVGKVSRGKLVNGEKLPAGPGYYRRSPRYSWGTNETITELLRVIAEVKHKHPDAHDLVLEHLSRKTGGHLKPHVSHQSGRDVDMGLYFEDQPREGPKRFLSGDKHPLDYEKTWTLLTALVGTNERNTRVRYIFLDYAVQKLIVDWAKKNKKKRPSDRLLKYMFQYPRSRRAIRGKIRHVESHRGHLHVRFKCPPGDDSCV